VSDQRKAFLESEGDAWYRRNAADAGTPAARLDRVIANLPNRPAVLEVGCSDGRKLAELATRAPGRYVGIDPSTAAITEGRRRWPDLELHVGSADQLPVDEQFDAVILGFFLYLCDRALLTRVVAEADRVLRDGGALVIVDFDPPAPRRRQYRHLEGVSTYKMDYPSLFLALPSYSLAEKLPFSQHGEGWTADETERIAMTILRKDLEGGYAIEDDVT
jgi:ubiquinone/menaquinone biosynthesis C-methylase UbiE